MGILYGKFVLYGNTIRWKDLQDLLSEKSKLLITVHAMLLSAGENRGNKSIYLCLYKETE